MSNPLQIQVNPEILQQRIETIIIQPRFCNDDASTGSGGSCQFVLPHRGYLSGDSRIILPAVCADPGYQYCPLAGCLSLISQATMRVGDIVVAQMDQSNKFMVMKQLLNHLEKRENVDCMLHGTASSFESCSGGKMDYLHAQSLPGQYRLVGNDGYSLQVSKVPMKRNALGEMVNTQIPESFKLKTFYNDTATEAGTPEYVIEISQLFPGYFNSNLQLPLQLINPDDEVSIELVFTDNTSWENNQRAILLPAEQSADHTGVIAVSLYTTGAGFTADQVDVYQRPDAVADRVSMKIKYSTTGAGVPYNISVVDCGAGYSESEILTFTNPAGGGTNLVLQVARRIQYASDPKNFSFTVGGTGYVSGPAVLVNPVNGDCDALCRIQANAGAVSSVNLNYDQAERFFHNGNGQIQIQIEQGDHDDAYCRVNSEVIGEPLTTNALNGVFTAGMEIEVTADTTKRAWVMDVSANAPTVINVVAGDWGSTFPITVNQVGVAGINCEITGGFSNPATILSNAGLGPSGLFGYDRITTGGKINIVNSKVRMATDLIYYEDGTPERDFAQMSSNNGLVKVYAEYANIQSSIATPSVVAGYGVVDKIKATRLIGLSNQVVRSLLIQNYVTGQQTDPSFPFQGLPKKNPLLMDYGSRSSLATDGSELQIVLNSVPRFPSPIDFSPHFFVELSEVFGKPFYLPHGMYNGDSSAKQRDNESLTANSKQPGFSLLDDITKATAQYELNDRKAAMSNVHYGGISQSWLRGNGFYMGINLRKINGQNFVGNGARIGAQAVEINYDYSATKDPSFQGNSDLNTYACVERVFQLLNGKVTVTSGSN